MSTALSSVNNGLGVSACLPYAASLVNLYGLEMRRLRNPEVRRRFFTFTRVGQTLSPAAQSFKDFMSEYIEAHPDVRTR
jgi:DNA-binding transcriptional LysR family regulator